MGEGIVTDILPPRTGIQKLQDRFSIAEIQEIVHYDELCILLGFNLDSKEDRRRMQTRVHDIKPWLLENFRRALDPVKNVGYLVIHPQNQRAKAIKQNDKTDRAHKRTVGTVVYTDLNHLTPTQQQQNFKDVVVVGARTAAMELTNLREQRRIAAKKAIGYHSNSAI
jgi:hypothetical protein